MTITAVIGSFNTLHGILSIKFRSSFLFEAAFFKRFTIFDTFLSLPATISCAQEFGLAVRSVVLWQCSAFTECHSAQRLLRTALARLEGSSRRSSRGAFGITRVLLTKLLAGCWTSVDGHYITGVLSNCLAHIVRPNCVISARAC